MLLPDWLAQRAATIGARPALIAGQIWWSFAELEKRADAMAGRLATLGIQSHDRVALLLRNGPEFVELVHAIARLRAVLAPLNTRLAAPELAYQLNDIGARLLIHDEPNAAVAARVRDSMGGFPLMSATDLLDETSTDPDKARAAEPRPPTSGPRPPTPGSRLSTTALIDLSAVHCIIYTAGTSGRPKGALLTYGNHFWSAVGSVLNLGHHEADRWLAALPLFHIAGLAILMRSVIYGIPAVVHEAFDPAAANRAISDEGVTIVSVVSTMLERMLAERAGQPYPSTLRCVLVGGGPAPRVLLEDCARLKVPVVQTYGLTETASQVATLSPSDALRKLGSSGKQLLPSELRVERDGAEARPGEVGEIVVRGPTISPGYVDQAAGCLDESGWFRTGDLGYLDEDGDLYVLDRRDDLIVSGGENVYPAEVEAVLMGHSAVEEAGVVGAPDQQWGQVPMAAIKLKASKTATPTELLAFCRERLAAYKVPVRISFVDALPRNAAGKLLRRDLRQP